MINEELREALEIAIDCLSRHGDAFAELGAMTILQDYVEQIGRQRGGEFVPLDVEAVADVLSQCGGNDLPGDHIHIAEVICAKFGTVKREPYAWLITYPNGSERVMRRDPKCVVDPIGGTIKPLYE